MPRFLSPRFCQFRQLEHFTAVQCNGNRSLDEIRKRVNAEFDASLSLETLAQFLARLRDLDLLESEVCQERLKSRRARVQGMDSEKGRSVVNAHVPLAEMLRYTSDLRSFTGGRGVFSMEEDHYEQVPTHLQAEIIAAKEKEDEEED